MNQTDAELKELWDLFRIGKAYPSEIEIMSKMRIFAKPNVERDSEFLPELVYEGDTRMAASGSAYWTETIDPPQWFRSYCGRGDVIDYENVFRMVRGEKRFRTNIRKPRMTFRKRDSN